MPIYELHGAFGDFYCIKCNITYDHDVLPELLIESSKIIPHCNCGSVIKPIIVLFGKSLPSNVISSAFNACEKCDCLIMVGIVSPANQVPFLAKKSGEKIIFVNKDDSSFEYFMDVFIQGLCGCVFPLMINKSTTLNY